MPGVRHKRKSKRWWISEAESRLAYAYALMYYEWLAEYHALAGIVQQDKDTERMQSATERDGLRRQALAERLEMIDQTLIETDADLYQWLKMAVTSRGIGYDAMAGKGIPCSDTTFYDRRRKFYYLLSKKI